LRVDTIPVSGQTVALPPGEAHHARAVLRQGTGEPVELLAPDGTRWAAVLVPDGAKALAELEGSPADPSVELEIWLPVLKGGRTDDLVRQLTELGVARIAVFESARAVARAKAGDASRAKLARWRSIAAQATKQCGRASVPEVSWNPGPPAVGPGIFLWERPGESLRSAVEGWREGWLRLLVGPEGGLDAGEAERLTAAGWTPGWLGPRVLRAETAVITAAVLGLHRLGEAGY
jgi:16S rRNA (uracil1498-N3)-methyltransferase